MKSIVGILLCLFFVVGCRSEDDVTGNTIKLTNPIQKCKMVDVPYEEQEAYIESEPYQAVEEYQVDMKYEVVGSSKSTTLNGLDVRAKGVVEIRNVDSETGTFSVKQTFKTLNGGTKTLSSYGYIMPGETKEFVELYDVSLGEDFNVNYVITPPKKTLTRTVTKYRDVTKYRTITK